MKRASDDLERQDVEAQRAADEAELEAWLVDAPAVLAAALAATPALEDIVTKVQRPCWCFKSNTAASPCSHGERRFSAQMQFSTAHELYPTLLCFPICQ